MLPCPFEVIGVVHSARTDPEHTPVEVAGRRVRFAGVDVLDATPVIDLKPYVARFDRPDGEPRCGWFDTVAMPDGVTPADLGPAAG